MNAPGGPLVEVIADEDWAAVVTSAADGLLDDGRPQRWCLATGATPRPLYRQWAERLDLSAVEVVLLDEWIGLDADDPGRCAAMLHHDLVEPMPEQRRPTVTAIDVDAPLDPQWPGPLDLAVVGLGANGHVGMNEPGTAPDSPTRRVDLAETTAAGALRYGARRRPTGGVTVGLGPLQQARRVWVIVTGDHKAGIVERALNGPETTDVPASLLRSHPAVTWWLDHSAAGRL